MNAVALALFLVASQPGAVGGAVELPVDPVSPDVAAVTRGDVTEARVDGMTLLVKRRPTTELVTTQLYIRGGARNWGASDAGVEALALRVATTGGTTSLDKEAFGRRLATLGASIDTATGRDWSVIQGKSLLREFEPTFGLLVDTFLRPALPESEVALARGQTVLALEREQESPDGALSLLGDSIVYRGLPYANRPDGTPKTVAKLGLVEIRAHLAKLREKSRLLLVVVGAVDPERVVALARQAFLTLPSGSYAEEPMPRPEFTHPSFTGQKRDLPTNYIQGFFTAPGPGAPDYAAARVGTYALNERLFEEVRTKRNLSYAPEAPYDVAKYASFSGLYVTAVDPDATLPVMTGQLTKLKEQPLPASGLAGDASQYRTRFLMSEESTDEQATDLGRGFLYTGDFNYFRKLLADAAKVTAADIQRYAQTYAKNLQFVLLGDPAKLDPKLTDY